MADSTSETLQKILQELKDLKVRNAQLEAKVDSLHGAATIGSPVVGGSTRRVSTTAASPSQLADLLGTSPPAQPLGPPAVPIAIAAAGGLPQTSHPTPQMTPDLSATKAIPSPYSQRVILTTYPGQVGIKPIPMNWGSTDPRTRGPVVASRHYNSIKIRNAIGAYGGSYSIYRALACAMGQLDPNHRPDYTNTEPPFDIPPNPSWSGVSQIVSMDPWGHLAPQLFKKEFDEGVDIRPTVAVTRAHIKMPELDDAVRLGRVPIDGKIVVRSTRLPGVPESIDPGCEVNVSKAAVEPCWYLPGVAERLGVTEGGLRRALFEDTGGMYPELLTRHDLKVFLPPISGLTAYIFGDPALLSKPDTEITVRVHDECNGSDVFGSDICTCRPYLLFGIEEAIKTAQRGGAGLVVYFRKEGRALGEVTKYLVYNARKRGTDSADQYFKRTENIAGLKDMRFQALMPDVLCWLGVTHITNMISMSNMKADAIQNAGIPIKNRYEIPPELIPADSAVEIQAKIADGYFSNSTVTRDSLTSVVGRGWDDIEH